MRTATLDRSDDRVRWVEEACRLGRMDACLDAAERRQNGNGVPVDMKLALQNYQAACRLSNAPSCFRAAKILRSGDGVKADPKAAAVWYDKACQMRQTRACAILGDLYLSGEGVDKDDVRARFYHNIAGSGALPPGCPKAGRGARQPSPNRTSGGTKSTQGPSPTGVHSEYTPADTFRISPPETTSGPPRRRRTPFPRPARTAVIPDFPYSRPDHPSISVHTHPKFVTVHFRITP